MKLGTHGRWGTLALLAFSVSCADDSTIEAVADAGSDSGVVADDSDDATSDVSDSTDPTDPPTQPSDSTEPVNSSTPPDAGPDTPASPADDGNSTSSIGDSGIDPSSPEAGPPSSDGGGADAGPALGTLEWTESDEWVGDVAVEYATLTVPLDYDDPEGASIELALARLRTTSEARAGVLMYNPGGPGPGVTGDALGTASVFSEVFPTMDLVLVDNRGTRNSTPIDCGSDEVELEVSDSVVQDEANWIEAFAAECVERHGDTLRFFNVENVARDMDTVRAALGEETLNFWGASYGTFQGAIYAKLFPQHVRAFVLDSPVVRLADGSPNWVQNAAQTAEAYETQLNRYFEWADENDESPLHGIDGYEVVEVDGGHDVVPVAAADAGSPNGDAGDAPVGEDAGASDAATVTTAADAGQVPAVLSAQATYDALNTQLEAGIEVEGKLLPASALKQATANLLRMGDWWSLAAVMWTAQEGAWEFLFELRNQDEFNGTTDESRRAGHANVAINLLDSGCPADFDFDTATETYEQLAASYPRIGADFALGVADCLSWEIEPKEPRVSADNVTAPPMLVMGALNDPATPYANAVALVEQLGNGSHLLTSDTEGHGVGSASACGVAALVAFIADPNVDAAPSVCLPGDLGAAAKLRSVVKAQPELRRRRR